MSPESKAICGRRRAEQIMENWKTCSLEDLNFAAEYFDSAILLLIARMGNTQEPTE